MVIHEHSGTIIRKLSSFLLYLLFSKAMFDIMSKRKAYISFYKRKVCAVFNNIIFMILTLFITK